LNVIQAVSLVDRMEGGMEAFSRLGVPMKAVFQIDELIASQ